MVSVVHYGHVYRNLGDSKMTGIIRNTIRLAALTGSLVLASAGSSALQAQQQTTQRQPVTPVRHHSILKGVAAGAVAGHMTHRRHGALIGAAIGAEVQHHRNKKAAKIKR